MVANPSPGFESERSAIEAAFQDAWQAETPVEWPNIAFTPPAQSAWVRFKVDTGTGTQNTIGKVNIRWPGQVMTMIFVPEGTGTREAVRLAEKVADIFQLQSIGEARFLECSITHVGKANGWYQVNAIIPYRRDRQQT